MEAILNAHSRYEETTHMAITDLITKPNREALAKLDELLIQCRELHDPQLGQMERALATAAALQRLRTLLTPALLENVMALQGTSLGFATDKDREGGYPPEVVRDVFLDASIRGLRAVGQEFCIISGRMYAAKNGLKRLIIEWPGLSDWEEKIGIPVRGQNYVTVPCRARWKLGGKADQVEFKGDDAIPIVVHSNTGVDAMRGKAARKLYAAVYDRLTGRENELVESEGPTGADIIDVPAKPVEPPQEEPANLDQRQLVAEYAIRFGQVDQVKVCMAILQEAGEDATLSKESLDKVQTLGNERIARIRASRGDRSNGGQRSLVEGQSATEAGL